MLYYASASQSLSGKKVSADDLRNHWIKDDAIFDEPDGMDEDDPPSAGTIRDTLMEHYEADRLRAEEVRKKRENLMRRIEAQKASDIAKGIWVDLNPKKRKAADSDAAAPDPKRAKTAYAVPTDPKDIDLCLITDAQLAPLLTPEILNHPRITIGPDIERNISYRAVLFVQHGGHFSEESRDRLKHHWSYYRNVFVYSDTEEGVDILMKADGKRQVITEELSYEIMRQRLAGKHETVDVSDESSGLSSPGGVWKGGSWRCNAVMYESFCVQIS